MNPTQGRVAIIPNRPSPMITRNIDSFQPPKNANAPLNWMCCVLLKIADDSRPATIPPRTPTLRVVSPSTPDPPWSQ